jgi:hypothetical protein
MLLMIGSPIDASGVTTLEQHRRARIVVTCDPLGVSRSERTDCAKESTPAEHADVCSAWRPTGWIASATSGSACSMSSTLYLKEDESP